MLNVKKLLTKVLGRITTQQTSISGGSYRNGTIYFRRQGDIVTCWSTGDFTSLPLSQSTNIGNIPIGYRPAYTCQAIVQNSTHWIAIIFYADGTIRAHCYNGGAISSASPGAFSTAWSAV